MSPARPASGSSRRNSGGSKPYTRCITPIVMYSMPVTPHPEQSLPPNPARDQERPGFPSYAQYKHIEALYLQSLTPRRQGKALISQALFDRIWDVLRHPETTNETAQFRFWARKMFTISKNHCFALGLPDNAEALPQEREVLLHDNLLVAIQEQLYDLLCFCHGTTAHGGRDKTCALIRKHYTWVPKDLVSNFIKSCPTCILKKCGNINIDGAVAMAQMAEVAKLVSEEPTSPSPMRGHFLQRTMYTVDRSSPPSPLGPSHGIPWPTTAPGDSPSSSPPNLEADAIEVAYREAVIRARGLRALAGVDASTTPSELQSHPMTREVSLYKGLPNGWQYRHKDYASAHAEFMRTKDLPRAEEDTFGSRHRPRVPSIAPMWGPDQFPHPEYGMEDADMGDAANMSFEDGMQEGGYALSQPSGVTLQYLLMTSPSLRKPSDDQENVFEDQLDPMLLAISQSGSSPPTHGEHPTTPPRAIEHAPVPPSSIASSANYPSSTSIKRAAAPLRLNLHFPSEKSFQALLAYRDSLGEGNLTPDSPVGSSSRRWHPGNPSPASSASSCSSQLSAFPLMMGDESALTTPANSALTTPVDECAGGPGGSSGSAIERVKGKGPESGLVDLSQGMQMACAL